MRNERLAIDLSDGYLAILGSSGSESNLELKSFFIKSYKNLDVESVITEVSAYILREKMSAPVCSVGLDSRSVLMKSYFFPFRVASKIESALKFELESSLPVKLNNLKFNWVYGPRVGNGTFIVAGCIEKKIIEDLSSSFASSGLKLAEIVEGSAQLASLSSELTPNNKLLLDIGRTRTVLMSFKNGILQNRALLLQGTESVINRLISTGVTYDQAYRLVYLTDFTRDNLKAEASQALNELNSFITQIKNQIQIYAEKNSFVPDVIEILGEGLEIKGIEGAVESALDIRTVPLLAHDLFSRFEDTTEANNAIRCYSLLLHSKTERLSFFRKEENLGQYGTSRGLKYAVGWFSILFLSFLVFFFAGIINKTQIINQTEARMDYFLRQAIPEVQSDFSYAQYVSILKSRIKSLNHKVNENSGGSGRAIEVWRMINFAANTPLDIILDELLLDRKKVELSGVAMNYEDVETFRTQLEKNNFFSAVSIKGASSIKKTKQVRFTVELLRKDLGE